MNTSISTKRRLTKVASVHRTSDAIAWFPVILIEACFGPYVLPSLGLRTEHIVMYCVVPIALYRFVCYPHVLLSDKYLTSVLVSLSFITLWTIVTSIGGIGNNISIVKLTASIENYIEPITVVAVVAISCGRLTFAGLRRTLSIAAVVYLVCTAANAVLAVGCMAFDLRIFLRPFAGFAEVNGHTVMELAYALGRYTGIFNQPGEAGLTYSAALLVWSYRMDLRSRTGSRIQGFLYYLLLGMLLIGGMVSTSKVFLLGGLPLFLLSTLRDKRAFRVALGLATMAAVLVSFGSVGVVEGWAGFARLSSLFDFHTLDVAGVLAKVTAGRVGTDYSVFSLQYARVLAEGPISGLGFGAESVLDSAYSEIFVQGGFVALLAYAVFLLLNFYQYGRFENHGSAERRLALSISVLIAIAGFGFPVITANRAGPAILIFLVLAHVTHRERTVVRHYRGGYNKLFLTRLKPVNRPLEYPVVPSQRLPK